MRSFILLCLFSVRLMGMQNIVTEQPYAKIREAIYRDFQARYQSIIKILQNQGARVASVEGKPTIEVRDNGDLVAELIVLLGNQRMRLQRNYRVGDEIDSISLEPCFYESRNRKI